MPLPNDEKLIALSEEILLLLDKARQARIFQKTLTTDCTDGTNVILSADLAIRCFHLWATPRAPQKANSP